MVGNKHQVPAYARDVMIAELEAFGRGPFREALVDLLEAKPNVEDLRAFAKRFPDRWSQAVTIIAKLAGYHETKVYEGNLHVLIHQMSDSALLKELESSEAIDVTPVKELDQ